MTQIGAAMGKDPRDAVMDLVIADRGESAVIISIMTEQDVRTALQHPLVGVGTDSAARAEDGKLAGSKSHPRGWGSFPRILGKYVRDEHLLTLEEAIRKMTSKAAARVHLTDRGILRAGMMADITIFDPVTIRDAATFGGDTPELTIVGIPSGAQRRISIGVVNTGIAPAVFRVSTAGGKAFEIAAPEDDLALIAEPERKLGITIGPATTIRIAPLTGSGVAFATMSDANGDTQFIPAVPSQK